MSVFFWVVIITTIAGVGGTGLGGLVGAFFKRDSEKTVSLLLSFAGGVMMSVVCFDLLMDAIGQNPGSTAYLFLVIGMVLVGYGVIYLLNFWIDKSTNHEIAHIDKDHPKTADQLSELIHSDHYEAHKKKKTAQDLFIGGVVMACAIALHNLPEGMVIGASYVNDGAVGFTLTGGLVLAIVIGLHNIPEGMSVSVPLIAGGMKKWKAVLLTAATGAPTILGAMLGYSLGAVSPLCLVLSLSFASGAMLYVVFGELLPEAILMWKSKAPSFGMLLGLLVGLIIIFA
ncbi:MAG TPA: ZIP family metal transporter [Candidatus Faecousia faecipullorum]|nr:ZIP family metal transporter [Candidatus Faecousia faecipullorum]